MCGKAVKVEPGSTQGLFGGAWGAAGVAAAAAAAGRQLCLFSGLCSFNKLTVI